MLRTESPVVSVCLFSISLSMSLLIVHTLSCSVDLMSKMMSKTAGHEVLLENSVVSKLETSLQTLTSFLDSQVRC